MSALFGFPKLKACAAYHHIHSELHELTDQIFQVQYSWTSFAESHVIDSIACLQFSVFKQLINNYTGNGISFQVHNNTGAFTLVTFIIYVCNALYNLFIHQLTNTVSKN